MQAMLSKYFPLLGSEQKEQLAALRAIYLKWNSMINVVSRKDMDNFGVHHVLHSLSVAKVFDFKTGAKILDVGTGGGFPGIPLAIFFPRANFILLDSIGKKIKVVSAVAEELGLGNVTAIQERAEDEKDRYDFVVSRAVTTFTALVKLVSKNLKAASDDDKGIICLKGGDISSELGSYVNSVKVWKIGDFFEESFFETKRIIWLPS